MEFMDMWAVKPFDRGML